jgi:pimeloyl-ACP methyl ester carboxylesterase
MTEAVMSQITTGTVTSPDGTAIAFDQTGTGPMVVLVHGAFTGKAHPTLSAVAETLSPWFTVINYDRRGRGESGDTPPYCVDREIDDLTSLIKDGDGPVMLFGGSSGAALAVLAAAQSPAVSKLALWEPIYHVSPSAPALPDDFAAQLDELVSQGRRAEAVELFLTRAAEVPADLLAVMRSGPSWPQTEAIAHTLVYEAAVMGPGNALPTAALAAISQPTLVLTGQDSPEWVTSAGLAVCAAIPWATHRVLEGQVHNVAPEALAPELLEFFMK